MNFLLVTGYISAAFGILGGDEFLSISAMILLTGSIIISEQREQTNKLLTAMNQPNDDNL